MAEPAEELDSLVHVNPSEAFPKRPLHKDNPQLECPFPELCGESVEFIGEASNCAVIVLSNYRLLICYRKSFVNVPLGLIENAECKEQEFLVIACKDGKSIRCQFDSGEQCQEWLYRVVKAIEPPKKLEDIFAFSFHAWCFDHVHREPEVLMPGVCFLEGTNKVLAYKFRTEIDRQGYDLKTAWRIFDNSDFKYCSTYPMMHIIPADIKDEEMKKSANFRTSRRFPSIVWRHKGNGAVIARCSQPEVGWFGWRSEEDEKIMPAILNACLLDDPREKHGCHSNGFVRSERNGITSTDSQDDDVRQENGIGHSDRRILIIDARSFAAAFANRAKGGGCEYPEYYTCCDIEWMGLANIHSIRKSFNSVHTLCSTSPDQTTWLSSLEATKWLQYVSMLIKSTIKVVTAVDQEARPVMVHCSDGWDRTPQIVALAEIMLDPYYRTMQGFQVLVEREWLEFGHKFADRCGHKPGQDDANERCPVFLQWLDCVHQLLKQFPTAFEFNETFLVKLVQHTYSCLYGTFLCNNLRQRLKHSIKERTCSVWSLLTVEGNRYRNFLYDVKTDKVLYPSSNVRDLELWIAVYLSETSHAICEETGPIPSQQNPQAGTNPADSPKLTRTRSFDNIHKSVSEEEPSRSNMAGDATALTRTSSDPNLSELKLENCVAGTSPKGRIIPPIPAEHSDNEESESHDTNEPITNGDLHEGGDDSDDSVSGRDHMVNGDDTPLENGVDDTPPSENGDSGHLMNGGDDIPMTNGEDIPLTNGLTNGHSGLDNETEPSGPLCSTPRKSDKAKMMLDYHMESSTETVTEDTSGENSVVDGPKMLIGPSDTNGTEDDSPCDSNGSSTPNGDVMNGLLCVNNKQRLQLCSSISTSTSDLSSHIGNSLEKPPSLPGKSPAGYGTHIPNLPTVSSDSVATCLKHLGGLSLGSSLVNGHASMPNTTTSEPSFPSCMSRTSSSSGINGHEASCGPHAQRQLKLGRHIDQDGLTCIKDHRQRRMLDILREQQQKIEIFRSREKVLLSLIEKLRLQAASAVDGNQVLLSELEYAVDLENGCHLDAEDEECRSHSRCNSIRSDVSWEQIDEGDTSRTLWIPDHAVSHCSLCNSRFNLVVRKHHCRNCGQIFCGSCSNFFVAIPREQLYHPQRVCQPCNDRLMADSRTRHENVMENGRKVTAVRDG